MKLGVEDRAEREGGSPEFDPPGPKVEVGGLAAAIGARNLMIIIITMPIFFLAAVAIIITVFGRPQSQPDAPAVNAVRSTPTAALDQPALSTSQAISPLSISNDELAGAITLPTGATTGEMSLDGNRLALRVDTADGAMIVIYDLAANAVVQTIPLISETQ